jgi:hypothetical protein
MKVIRCDRCGRVFQTGGKVVNVAGRCMRGITGVDFDLCNDCERLFMKWLKREENYD